MPTITSPQPLLDRSARSSESSTRSSKWQPPIPDLDPQAPTDDVATSATNSLKHALDEQAEEYRNKYLCSYWWRETSYRHRSEEMKHALAELQRLMDDMQHGQQWQVFAGFDRLELAFRNSTGVRRQMIQCLDTAIADVFADKDCLDHKKLDIPDVQKMCSMKDQLQSLRLTSVVVVPEGDGHKVVEGKRFRFKEGTPAQLRQAVPGIVFTELNTPGEQVQIVVSDPTTWQHLIDVFSKETKDNVLLVLDTKDTLGWLAQAMKHPHQDPWRCKYTTEHQKILSEFVAQKVADIQNSPAVKGTVLAWLTRGFKRSLWVEQNFMFLEGEMFNELKNLQDQKKFLTWSVLGHVAAKLVDCGDINPLLLNDPDAANKLKIITWMQFPTLLAGFSDIQVVWESKMDAVAKTRNTALAAAATACVTLSQHWLKQEGSSSSGAAHI